MTNSRDIPTSDEVIQGLKDAIRLYERVQGTEKRLATQRELLQEAVSTIPWNDVPDYLKEVMD